MVQDLVSYPTTSGALDDQAQYPSFELRYTDVANTVPSKGWNICLYYDQDLATGVPDRGYRLTPDGFNANGINWPAIDFDIGYGGIDGRPGSEPWSMNAEGYMYIPSSGEPGYVAEEVERVFKLAANSVASLYVGSSATFPSGLLVADCLMTAPEKYSDYTEASHDTVFASGRYIAGTWYSIRCDYICYTGEGLYSHCVLGFYDVDPSGSL